MRNFLSERTFWMVPNTAYEFWMYTEIFLNDIMFYIESRENASSKNSHLSDLSRPHSITVGTTSISLKVFSPDVPK